MTPGQDQARGIGLVLLVRYLLPARHLGPRPSTVAPSTIAPSTVAPSTVAPSAVAPSTIHPHQ
ncbi:hypothetical protein ABT095_27890 [Kitasatospora sp. NPDC002227]|uniref:hypothetical protein n=1 Tax=Kitasatospora sp. NPDC002227 TaxID=3154773 RepID=UPI003331E9DD